LRSEQKLVVQDKTTVVRSYPPRTRRNSLAQRRGWKWKARR